MKVYINGIEYSAESDFTISEQAGNKTSSSVSVVVDNQPFPVAGDVIEVQSDDGTPMFLGTCGIPKSPKYQTGLEKKVYTITCGNANSILSNRIINVAYQGETVSTIVQNLFDQYISEEGISLGAISQIDVTLEVYTAADFNLQDALNELADLVGAVWTIDQNKKFWFVVSQDFPKFPEEISESLLLGTDLQHTTKDYYTRTVQYVTGATDVTTQQTETFVYDGQQNSLITVFPISQKPTIFVNDIMVSSSLIGVNGLDDDDPNIVFSFSFNSQTVAIKNKDYLASGDKVVIQYIGMYPIRVVAYNNAKIKEIAQLTGTSGKRERVYLASDIATTADASQLAQSLLSQFSEATGEITFWLLQSQLTALGYSLSDLSIFTQVTFNLQSLGIVGDYVITERTISLFSPNTENFKISFKLCNRDYLKSYAQTISALYRDISQLYIRQEDIVIEQPTIEDAVTLEESISACASWNWAPTPTTYYNTIFSGFSFGNGYYPSAGNTIVTGMQPIQARYPSNNSQIFAGGIIGNDYPI